MIRQYEPLIRDEDIRAVELYLRSGGWITEHTVTETFEQAICKVLDAKYASVVNNGTLAISLALSVLGVKSTDVVLVPDWTMIATSTACDFIGAYPIPVDVSTVTGCMDVDKARETIKIKSHTARPKALIYVSLNGRWDNTEATKELFQECRKEGIKVIEDAAQSFGSASLMGTIGTLADITTFSFSPHKIITTGQGGALVTQDEVLHERIERLKDFGRLSGGEDIHDSIGINAKFTDLQAAIGVSQLSSFELRKAAKRSIYKQYRFALQRVKDVRFIDTNLSYTVPWFVDIYTDLRDELYEFLKGHGIETRKVYPALHEQPCYQWAANCPAASWFARRGLWLPSSMNLTTDQIEMICDCIKDFFDDFRRTS